jgi:hypothetical protein
VTLNRAGRFASKSEGAVRSGGRRDAPTPEIIDARPHGTANERSAKEGEQRRDKAAEHDRFSHHCETEGRDNSVLHRILNLLEIYPDAKPAGLIPKVNTDFRLRSCPTNRTGRRKVPVFCGRIAAVQRVQKGRPGVVEGLENVTQRRRFGRQRRAWTSSPG